MSETTPAKRSNFPIFMVLTVLLCIAKAAGFLEAVPWIWCFAPLWLPIVTMFVIFVGIVTVAIIGACIVAVWK